MKEVIAQHMVPSVINAEVPIISKIVCPSRNVLFQLEVRRAVPISEERQAAATGTDGHLPNYGNKTKGKGGGNGKGGTPSQEETTLLQGQEKGVCCDFKARLSPFRST